MKDVKPTKLMDDIPLYCTSAMVKMIDGQTHSNCYIITNRADDIEHAKKIALNLVIQQGNVDLKLAHSYVLNGCHIPYISILDRVKPSWN